MRPYQADGLSWLSFLREVGLGGILADDMGLGKTVQALALIAAEKAEGRLDRPALVIAPTSLMANWRLEAEKFAPNLKVLTLHGLDRKQRFAAIADSDLVLTTYPLIGRDKDVLKGEIWSLLFLDEAQTIKNPDATTTRLIRELNARQRFALTGTPLENHLGELWSLFNVVSPGFLGDRAWFSNAFRTPIEKHGDKERARQLARRVKPFLLRRTKNQVASELPPKTEMVERIEMEREQRDIYKSIRLAMHTKVRAAIAAKGLNRSRIIVLDALLKMRQACCDPRLLKLPAKHVAKAKSAKLERLDELLGELMEEDRRILIFSQFTSMLDLIRPRLDAQKTRLFAADRRHPGSAEGNPGVPERRDENLSDQPEGRRRGLEPHRRRHGDPLRPLVESGGRGAGDRPRPPHRPGQAGVRPQAGDGRDDRGKDGGDEGAQTPARRKPVRRGRRAHARHDRSRHRHAVFVSGEVVAPVQAITDRPCRRRGEGAASAVLHRTAACAGKSQAASG